VCSPHPSRKRYYFERLCPVHPDQMEVSKGGIYHLVVGVGSTMLFAPLQTYIL